MILNCTVGRHITNFVKVIEQIEVMSVRMCLSVFCYRCNAFNMSGYGWMDV